MKMDIIIDEKKKSQKLNIYLIEATDIQVSSNSKLGFPKFISFSLLIDKFSHFKWLITAFFIKVDIVVDEKKKLQKLNTYWERTPITGTATANPGHLNLSAFQRL